MISLRPSRTMVVSPTVMGGETHAPQLTPGLIQGFMRARGVHEDILVHTQDYREFLREKGVTELGRGGEGAVYFLRGHVVKLTGVDFTPALLREIVHMLHLNPISGQADGAAMGERQRIDVPGLLWVYTLSNGGLSVGMKPFDASDHGPRGSTLYDRLFGGPPMERDHILRALLAIAKTLVYTQKKGLVHHDLKPANIYIPGDPQQDPVVFDLGQALWKQNVWGANWLKHGHNLHYWYNGTYQYMHRGRRAAHLCAIKISGGNKPTECELNAFSRYVPSMYDDVFAFAYIVRDAVRSKGTKLLEIDKRLLTDYYKALMGLYRPRTDTQLQKKKTILGRVQTLFSKDAPPPKLPAKPPLDTIDTMEQAYAKLQPVMLKLMGIK
jgi:serine/threonine protein kinase